MAVLRVYALLCLSCLPLRAVSQENKILTFTPALGNACAIALQWGPEIDVREVVVDVDRLHSIHHMAVSHDGRTIAVLDSRKDDGPRAIVRAPRRTRTIDIERLNGGPGFPNLFEIAISNGGTTVAVTGPAGIAIAGPLSAPFEFVLEAQANASSQTVAVAPSGHHVAVSAREGHVKIFTHTGAHWNLSHTLEVPPEWGQISALAFSTEGQYLVAGTTTGAHDLSKAGRIALWNQNGSHWALHSLFVPQITTLMTEAPGVVSIAVSQLRGQGYVFVILRTHDKRFTVLIPLQEEGTGGEVVYPIGDVQYLHSPGSGPWSFAPGLHAALGTRDGWARALTPVSRRGEELHRVGWVR